MVEWLQFAGSPLGQALFFGFLASALTFIFIKQLGQPLLYRDLLFIVGTMVVVFLHRWRRQGMHHDLAECGLSSEKKKQIAAPTLDRLETFYVPSGTNGITHVTLDDKIELTKGCVHLIVFFATYCKSSRAALCKLKETMENMMQHPKDGKGSTSASEGTKERVKVILLTQESKEELNSYGVLGKNMSNFMPLKELGFHIAIEDGLMFKKYQLEHGIKTLPHCYVIGKDLMHRWQGHPFGPLERELQNAINMPFEDNTAHRSKTEKVE